MEWAVGKSFDLYRPGTGKLLLPGAQIRWELHLHAVGEQIRDHVELAIGRGLEDHHVLIDLGAALGLCRFVDGDVEAAGGLAWRDDVGIGLKARGD